MTNVKRTRKKGIVVSLSWDNLTDKPTATELQKATSAEINSGANDAKFITPAALRGSFSGFETIGIACSDIDSDLTTGQKVAFDMPFDFVATRVFVSLVTAPTGSTLTVDVKDEGTTILSTFISVADSEYNSETSVFTSSASSYALTKGDLVSISVEQIGSTVAGTGLIVFLEGYRT